MARKGCYSLSRACRLKDVAEGGRDVLQLLIHLHAGAEWCGNGVDCDPALLAASKVVKRLSVLKRAICSFWCFYLLR